MLGEDCEDCVATLAAAMAMGEGWRVTNVRGKKERKGWQILEFSEKGFF